MKIKYIVGLLAGLCLSQAQAGYVYVGSWEVNSGPAWGSQPLSYTGQDAAALLFGGAAGDYAISTLGSDVGLINHSSWYSVIGYFGPNNGGVLFAEDYVSSNSSQAPGYYYSGASWGFDDMTEAASAYVSDNAGSGNVNYAFRFVEDVPEPESLLLLGLGLTCLAVSRRRMFF